jgi:hypothetical protein
MVNFLISITISNEYLGNEYARSTTLYLCVRDTEELRILCNILTILRVNNFIVRQVSASR